MRSTKVLFACLFSLFLCAGAALPVSADETREQLEENLLAQLDVREATGHNDGPEIKAYLNHVGLPEGYAWCAAFVSYNLDAVDVSNPRTAWSPSYAAYSDRIYGPKMKNNISPRTGDVFSLYFSRLNRVGHVGFVLKVEGDILITIEGNTNGAGSREGDGVYRKRRDIDKIYCITRYIHEEGLRAQIRTDFDRYRKPVSYSTYSGTYANRLQKPEKNRANGNRAYQERERQYALC